MDQATPSDQAVLRHIGERREEPGMDRRQHLRAGSDCPEAAEAGFVAAFDVASSERDAF